jgi:hypothetical protein
MEAQNFSNKPEITKEWLANKIKENPTKVIGRALLAIYNNQTSVEQSMDTTKVCNGIGFCKPDARVGSIGARMFSSKATLQSWVVEVWMRPAKDGYPRICKYASQLHSIALAKKAALERNSNLIIL